MKYLFPTQDFPPRIHYEKIFSLLPSFPDQREKKRGRPAYCKDSILQTLIYKNLRGLPTLSELVFELKNNPAMADILGFPIWKTPPSIERFSHFLRDTPNENLQRIRLLLVRRLIEEKILSGEILALDSCAIEANVKENNLKTAVASRFDKTIIPSGDPEAKLGIKVHYPKPFQRKITFFWGYRNHAVSDTLTELPLHERTLTADQHEQKQAVSMLKELQQSCQISIKAVTADANYDTEEILSYIFHEMKAMPVIPKNPRGPRKDDFKVKKNTIICPANLEMHRRGKMTTKGRTYLQYSCPLYYGKKYKGHFLLCPASHPKYFSQKGCNYLIRLSPTVRQHIDYDSKRFKGIYHQRTSAERIFSRLLTITMLRPTIIGFQSTQNHCTLAHITVLLIALAAHRLGFYDKIRFVKSFLPNLAL
jgi:hypothetical protein